MLDAVRRFRAPPGVWLEVLLFLPVLVLLYREGLLGRAPLWLSVLLMVAGASLGHESVQRWLAGGDIRRRLWPRIALHSGVVVAFVYALGWGPVLVVAFVAIQVVHTPWVGSAAWRPSTVFVTLWFLCAQAAVAAGWVFTHIGVMPSTGAAGLGVFAFIVANRYFGKNTLERERAEATVRANQERFRALIHDSSDVICVLGAAGRITYVSPAIERVTGHEADRLDGTHLRNLVHADDRARFDEVYRYALADGDGEQHCEVRLRHAEGGWRWYETTLRNLMGNAAVAGVVGTLRDVTERREAHERLAYEANHDTLTGLANRGAFLRALEHVIRHGGPDGGTPAVLFIDLDHFKEINDTLGHEAGDALLVTVAGMLRRSVLGSDVVGRLGGDEFAAVLTGTDAARSAVAVADRLLRAMGEPVIICGQPVVARASIGIAVADHGDTTSDELIRRADMAMYEVKRGRTHAWRFYEPSSRS